MDIKAGKSYKLNLPDYHRNVKTHIDYILPNLKYAETKYDIIVLRYYRRSRWCYLAVERFVLEIWNKKN